MSGIPQNHGAKNTAVVCTLEAALANLFPYTAIGRRRPEAREQIDKRRRAYLAGASARVDCLAQIYMDEAERARFPLPQLASSYDRLERQAYEWGWEDAALGRLRL